MQLKWMQYAINYSRTISEHLQIMSGMVRDFKAIGLDVYQKEQVLNMIRLSPMKMDIGGALNSL